MSSVLVKKSKFIPIDILRQLFFYEDGVLYWNYSNSIRCPSGKPAGYRMKNGYMETSFMFGGVKVRHYNHRLIYTLVNGHWPTKVVDHIDRDNTNNKIENLRELDDTQSNLNTSRKSDKTNTRNISKHTDGFQVEFARYGERHRKFFKKLKDAKKYRDEVLENLTKGDPT